MTENNEITIREIFYSSEEYKEVLRVRDEVLRKPLGMSLYDENLDGDKTDIHIAAFDGEIIVGVLLLKPVNKSEVKMRQVAVLETYQSRKTGTKLVYFAEKLAKSLGYTKIILHAREVAVGFYLKLGYIKSGDEFTEIGIPHYKMMKVLE